MIRAFRTFPSKPKVACAEIGNVAWPRNELLEVARLLDRLAPPSSHDPERYFEQVGARPRAPQAGSLGAAKCVKTGGSARKVPPLSASGDRGPGGRPAMKVTGSTDCDHARGRQGCGKISSKLPSRPGAKLSAL